MLSSRIDNISKMVKKVYTCKFCQRGHHCTKAALLSCKRRVEPTPSKQNQDLTIPPSMDMQNQLQQQRIQTKLIPSYIDDTLRNNHFRRALQCENSRQSLNCFKGIQTKLIKHPQWKNRFKRVRSSKKFIKLLIEKTAMIERVKKIFIQFMKNKASKQWQGHLETLVSQYYDKYVEDYGEWQNFGDFRLNSGYQLLGEFIRKLPYTAIKRLIRQQEKAVYKQVHDQIYTLDQLRKTLRRQFRQTFRTHRYYNRSGKRDEESLQANFNFLFTAAWHNSQAKAIQLLSIHNILGVTHRFLKNVMLPAISNYRGTLVGTTGCSFEPLVNKAQPKHQPNDRYQADDFMSANFDPRPLITSSSVSPSLFKGQTVITHFRKPKVIMTRQVFYKRLAYVINKKCKDPLVEGFQLIKTCKRKGEKKSKSKSTSIIRGMSGRMNWNINIIRK